MVVWGGATQNTESYIIDKTVIDATTLNSALCTLTFTFLSSQGLVTIVKAIPRRSQGLIRKGGRVSMWVSCDIFGALRHS